MLSGADNFYTSEKPEDVDVNEILFRPTRPPI